MKGEGDFKLRLFLVPKKKKDFLFIIFFYFVLSSDHPSPFTRHLFISIVKIDRSMNGRARRCRSTPTLLGSGVREYVQIRRRACVRPLLSRVTLALRLLV